jgi:hypothetical protein
MKFADPIRGDRKIGLCGGDRKHASFFTGKCNEGGENGACDNQSSRPSNDMSGSHLLS